MSKRSRFILMVAGTALASQIYLNMFADGFIIALSPVMMALFLYLFRDLDPRRAICAIALASPLFRLLVMIMQSGNIVESMHLVLPDMAFFFAYAFLFCYPLQGLGYRPYHLYYLRIALCDLGSNTVELSARVASGLAEYSLETFRGFLLLALVRSLLIVFLCIGIDLYRSLLDRQEREEHYKRLVILAASLNSEVYFMEKNMNEIEDIMKNAFSLYRTLQSEDMPKTLQDTSLAIAKDIHEVKKGYRRVIKGIRDSFLSDFSGSGSLYLKDLLQILTADIKGERADGSPRISVYTGYETDYLIQKHYAFMSIVRNMVSNAIDALSELPADQHGELFIRCRDVTQGGTDYCVVEVRDNGPGISASIRDALFIPGFSTKYDEATGDINRGLGLTLVKDLMEEKFHGFIEVETPARGALFQLWFPVRELTARENSYTDTEEEKHAILHS